MRVAALALAFFAGSCTYIIQPSEASLEDQCQNIAESLGPSFHVQVVDQFWLVASNADASKTQQAIRMLQDYASSLQQTYFDVRATRPVHVYLFRDRETYQDYCRRAYSDPPKTPFGFYMPHQRRIVLNLGTGQGVLAHELVHPLMEADFPRAPAWFNEGFASVFEQSKLVPGHEIEGMVNWRLKRLKRTLSGGRPPRLVDTLNLTRDDFYDTHAADNYAVARYLCLYLQKKALLTRFYKEFRSRVREDETGKKILESATGKSLAGFEPEFWEWVKSLSEE